VNKSCGARALNTLKEIVTIHPKKPPRISICSTNSTLIMEKHEMEKAAHQKSNQPNWLRPIFGNIPDELKAQPWGVWIAEPRLNRNGDPTGKWNKAPRNPSSGIKIGANQPEAFGTYEEAKQAYEDGGYTGIGVLLTGSGIVGIDLDNCPTLFKERPEIGEWLKEAIDKGIYCEISPSGNGSRLFSLGQLPNGCPKKQGSLEIYDDGRFLTVTGHQVKGGSNE
jgi:primase-polymerase (primpol)-like protein